VLHPGTPDQQAGIEGARAVWICAAMLFSAKLAQPGRSWSRGCALTVIRCHGERPMSFLRSPLSGAADPAKGIVLMLLATFLFASHDALSKYLCGFYPVIMVVWARYLVHTLLMGVIFLPGSGLRVLRSQRPGLQVLRALCLLGCSVFFTSGLLFIPLAEATAVNFLAPLMVTALSMPLLKERITLAQWVVVAVGFAGVAVIVHPGGAMFTAATVLPLLAAVCFSFYQLLTRVLSAYDTPTTSNFFTGVLNTLLMSGLVPFFWQLPSWPHIPLILLLGACGMFAHLVLTKAFRCAAPAWLAPFGYFQIVFAGLLGYIVFGRVPEISAKLGMVIVCLSGLAAAYLQRGRR
jgi:drug/metabolite transporter (DMT)-like permease